MRDYGTATWEGGDVDCQHSTGNQVNMTKDRDTNRDGVYSSGVRPGSDNSHCRLCGARRIDNQIGLEPDPESYVARLVDVFREVRRLLRDDGCLWLNLGDSFQDKQLLGIPWRVAFALQADGWILRMDIIWAKPNPMPESVSGSHFFRHRVTIEEYENLPSLRKEQRREPHRASDLPSLSARESVGSETSLSAEREGASNGAGAGTARGGEGEAAASQPISARAIEQSQIRSDGKGQGDAEESSAQVSYRRQGQTESRSASSGDQRHTVARGTEATSEPALHAIREMESEEAQGLRKAQGGDSARSSSNGGRLVGDSSATQESLLLLQEETHPNDRPRNSSQQGRAAREGEYRASVSELQLEEEGQSDSPLLVDCPGCPKCEKHNGYILQLSAGRPTKAHEYIFLLSKSSSYFYDADAIKEPVQTQNWTPATGKNHGDAAVTFRNDNGRHGGGQLGDPSGRNRRSVWTVNTQSYDGAHFATYPTKLVEPCILAGTSAHGCCVACGSPWERVVERTNESNWQERKQNGADSGSPTNGHNASHGKGVTHTLPSRETTTTGWQPTCACGCADVVPCTVLDPFAGSGTTLAVALKHGRRGLGIELNADYIELAHTRIRQSQPMLLDVTA